MLMWSRPKSTDKQTNKRPEDVIAFGYSYAFNFNSSNNAIQVLQAITLEYSMAMDGHTATPSFKELNGRLLPRNVALFRLSDLFCIYIHTHTISLTLFVFHSCLRGFDGKYLQCIVKPMRICVCKCMCVFIRISNALKST